MKKMFFLSAVVCIALLACNQVQRDRLTPGADATASQFKARDSLPRDTALAMIDHYRTHYRGVDTTLVRKNILDTMQISLNISDLNEIFKLDSITRIRLFAAAYLPGSRTPNKVTVLVQLKHGYHSVYSYYDAESFICPPPLGCGTGIE
jgi:hypothetical protein